MTFDSLGVHSTKELTEQYNAARQFIFNYFFGDNIPEPYETKTIYIDNRPYKENYYQNDKVIISERESKYYGLVIIIKNCSFKMRGILFGDNWSADNMHFLAYKNILIFNDTEYSNCIQTAEENRGLWHIMPNFIQVLKNMVPDLTASC